MAEGGNGDYSLSEDAEENNSGQESDAFYDSSDPEQDLESESPKKSASSSVRSQTGRDQLKIGFINVAGLTSKLKETVKKNENEKDLREFLNGFDILGFAEIHIQDKDPMVKFDNFLSTRKNHTHQKAKQSLGGTALLYRKDIEKYVKAKEIKESDNPCILWLSVSKKLTRLESKLIIGCVYIPLQFSRYACGPAKTCFANINKHIKHVRDRAKTKHCILIGDMNARTSDLIDYESTLHTRHSKENTTNTYGRQLIKMLKERNLSIVNGRVGRDAGVGNLTSNQVALIDYTIANRELFQRFDDFQVHEFNKNISDHHCALSLTLRCMDAVGADQPEADKRISLETDPLVQGVENDRLKRDDKKLQCQISDLETRLRKIAIIARE